jgi:hypothetical protein
MVRERTMTWMPAPAGPTTRPPVTVMGAQASTAPDLELPAATGPRPEPGPSAAWNSPVQPLAAGRAPAAADRTTGTGSITKPGPAVRGRPGGDRRAGCGRLCAAETRPAPAPQAKARLRPPAAAPAPAPEPAAGAPVPTPAPHAAARVQRRRRLHSHRPAQTQGHAVELTLVRTTVRSEKDAIEFTVKSNQDGYLYVLNHGSDGSLMQVYPNRKSGAIRVRKDAPLDLPRKTDDELKISGPSGSNQLLVMVSKHPREMSPPARVDGGYAFYQTGPRRPPCRPSTPGPSPGSPASPSARAPSPVPTSSAPRWRSTASSSSVARRPAAWVRAPDEQALLPLRGHECRQVHGLAAGGAQLRGTRHARAAVHRRPRRPGRQRRDRLATGLQRQVATFGRTPSSRREHLPADIACLLIDEAQFLTPAQVRQLHRLAHRGRVPVICYGLRSDFRGEAFPGSAQLLTLADDLEEMKTICACARKASMNMRLGRRRPPRDRRRAGRDRRQRPLPGRLPLVLLQRWRPPTPTRRRPVRLIPCRGLAPTPVLVHIPDTGHGPRRAGDA